MTRILHSLLDFHDLRLVLLAAVICAFGTVSTLGVSNRVAENRYRMRWLAALSTCAGLTVWATHFIAMLAYMADVPTTYHPGWTILSFLVGAVVMGAGFHVALRPNRPSWSRLLGGALLGTGVVLLHYLGMAAMRVPGHVHWAGDLVLLSIALSVSIGAAALYVAFDPLREYAHILGTVLICAMVVSLHFSAMGAVAVEFGAGEMASHGGVSRPVLVAAVAIASLFVLLIGLVSAIVDERITHQASKAVALVRASEARFRAIYDYAALGISVIDSDTGELLALNAAFYELLGYERGELEGRIAASLSPAEDAIITKEPVQNLRLGLRDSITVEKRFTRKDGETIWGNLTVSRVDDGGSERKLLVGMLEDITERKTMEAQLLNQAFHDRLTGLANRALFHDRVEHALSRARSSRTRVGSGSSSQQHDGGIVVMFVDLDGFKHVNDSLGHSSGDKLLSAIGARIAACVRDSDTVARLGGDEFAILVEDAPDARYSLVVADRVLNAMRVPVVLDERKVVTSASIGIAHASVGDDTDVLLRSADAAMYAAKANGKGRYAVYNPDMHRRALERLQLEADLRNALELGELELHYQPLINLELQSIYGAEALIRWRHKKLGLIAPAQFIPLAEETGLIIEIGEWVLKEACRQAMEWRTLGSRSRADEEFLISVNISGRQLQDAGLLTQVAAALDESSLPAECLVLEITESVVMQKVEFAYERLLALKRLGVGLALDDFGTGYSSLSQLRKFPFDSLKIDKSFVDGISSNLLETTPSSMRDAALVRTIIALGQALGLRVVAEGIEASEQSRALQRLGCDSGQGFYYAVPLRAEEFAEELQSRSVEQLSLRWEAAGGSAPASLHVSGRDSSSAAGAAPPASSS